MRRLACAAVVFVLASAVPALSQDAVEARTVVKPMNEALPGGPPTTMDVDVSAPGKQLWSGSLTLGPQYGNAYFSQSKNEYVPPCEGERREAHNRSNANTSLNFNISRANWQQEPDQFNVNFTWTRPLSPCDGQGTDNFGFTRTVDIAPGQSVTIRAAGDVSVRISRRS